MTEVDIAVAGGGLSGLTAGLQAARLGRQCTVLTGDVPGGLLLSIESVQGLPGHAEGIAGYDLCPMTQEQAMEAGAQCITGEVVSLAPDDASWRVETSAGPYRARSVIVASGCRLKTLGIPGEERLRGKGVSHCASCDAPLLRNRTVAVVGGGDAACQEALTLAVHAAYVHLLHRGAALRAQDFWRRRVSARRNVIAHPNSLVDEIVGEQAVRALRVRDAAGGTASELLVDAVFVYVGLAPNTEFLSELLPLDAKGRLPVDDSLRCSRRGLFAAGSVRAGSCGQALGAASDGVRAAFAAHRFLGDGAWPN